MGGAGLLLAGAGGGTLAHLLHRINRIAPHSPGSLERLRAGGRSPLLDRFPLLARSVPWRPLGARPTPVEPLPLPDGSREIRLAVKRDDLTSLRYGGNKVRKLEHFLAEAELLDRRTLVTLGGIGSNHALATALHGKELGFAVDIALYDQPVTDRVRRQVRALLHAGARLHYAGGKGSAFLACRRLVTAAEERGERPYFINVGGTSRLGVIGYVAAGLELADQVRRGELPEPDRVFVALGTSGTAAGLLAGFRIGGLGSRVSAVRVTGLVPANRFVARHFAQDAVDWLRERDATVPPVRIRSDDVHVHGGYLGPGYGVSTREAEAAEAWGAPRLVLETTYTGKTLAACLDYCREEAVPGESVLFWNTYSAAEPPRVPSVEGAPRALRERLRSA